MLNNSIVNKKVFTQLNKLWINCVHSPHFFWEYTIYLVPIPLRAKLQETPMSALSFKS